MVAAGWEFVATWRRPNGEEIDITSRVLLEELGTISESISGPQDLNAFEAGDFEIVVDDEDGFFSSEFDGDTANDGRLNDVTKRFQFSLKRDGVQLFRGFVLPPLASTDQKAKVDSITAFDGMRLLDEQTAEIVRRPFSGDLRVIATAAVGDVLVYLSSANEPFEQGDRVSVDGREFEVLGGSVNVLYLSDPIDGNPIPANAPLEVLTPYYRNRSAEFLIEKLFEAAGISFYDIRFTGLIGRTPFESTINTSPATGSGTGLDGFGAIRGILFDYPTAGSPTLIATMQRNHSNGESGIRASASPSAGFAPTGRTLATSPTHGGIADLTQQSESFDWVQSEMDTYRIVGRFAPSMTVHRKVYAVVLPNGFSTPYMYELHFSQVIAGLEIGVPDWESGGGAWDVTLRRYETVDDGVTWSLDTTFATSGEYTIGTASSFSGPSGGLHEFSISGMGRYNGFASYDSLLYISTWFGGTLENPDTRILRLKINGGSVVEVATMHYSGVVQPGECRALYTTSKTLGMGTKLISVFWVDKKSWTLVLDEDNETTFTSTQSVGLGSYRVHLDTLRWNRVSGDGSRIALIFSSAAKGTGYAILTPGNSQLSAPADVLAPVYSSTVHPYPVVYPSDPFSDAADGWQLTSQTADIFVPANLDTIKGPLFLTPYVFTVDGVGSVAAWLGYFGDRWALISEYHSGFFNSANFDGLTVGKALRELALVYNADVNVEFDDANPVGVFVSRDLERLPIFRKDLTDKDGNKPAGAVQEIVESHSLARAWEHNYPLVNVKGSRADISATFGFDRYNQESLEISSRFIDTQSLADVIAERLFLFFGPANSTFAAPSILPVSGASTRYEYVVVAVDAAGDTVAVSATGQTTQGAPTLGGGAYNTITWGAVLGATSYRVYRTLSEGSPSTLGYLGSTTSLVTNDDGTTLGPGQFPPNSLKRPRRYATVGAFDDVTRYKILGEVRLFDPAGKTDPNDPSVAPLWLIYSVEYDPDSPIVTLGLVEKEIV